MYFELYNDDMESSPEKSFNFYIAKFHSKVLNETFYYQKSYLCLCVVRMAERSKAPDSR